jgi:hypothetical protein
VRQALCLARQVALQIEGGIRSLLTYRTNSETLRRRDPSFRQRACSLDRQLVSLQATGLLVNTRKIKKVAERVGFEPTVGINLHTLSKRAP